MIGIVRGYRLSDSSTGGVSCDASGLFVGSHALLEKIQGNWRPRSLPELNAILSKYYDFPIDLAGKINGITTVACALDRGDTAYAQIAALNLRFPDRDRLAKGRQADGEREQLAFELASSGLLRKDWDSEKHPRWPAGSPDSVGGQFSPGGSRGPEPAAPANDGSDRSDTPRVIPVAKPDREKELEEAAERDYAICRSLRDPAVKARCWASANERNGARIRGKPLPPLVTWRETAPQPRPWLRLPIL